MVRFYDELTYLFVCFENIIVTKVSLLKISISLKIDKFFVLSLHIEETHSSSTEQFSDSFQKICESLFHNTGFYNALTCMHFCFANRVLTNVALFKIRQSPTVTTIFVSAIEYRRRKLVIFGKKF